MHLLVRERVGLDETAGAEDLGLEPADLVFLSFSDSDLASVRGVVTGHRVVAVPLARLAHPMSVDLFLERTVAGSGAVVVRLLGGIDYWRYGMEELAACCRREGVALAAMAGDRLGDERLAGLSTVGGDVLGRLERMLREGGPVNTARALGLGLALAGRAVDEGAEAVPVPSFGAHVFAGVDPGVGAEGRVGLVFYRSHLLAGDVAPHAALVGALAARGIETRAWFVDSLKNAATGAALRAALSAWRPEVVVNATGFSAREGGCSPLEVGVPVLQVVLAGTGRAEWERSARGLGPADLAMQVVLPELDGRLMAGAIGVKEERGGTRVGVALDEGVEIAAGLAAGWVRLARRPAAERTVAVVLSDYPGVTGASHAVGYAVGLDSLASLAGVLGWLREAGYDLGPEPLPCSEALTGRLLAGRRRVLRFGRVIVAVQPGRGGEARATYHDGSAEPGLRYRAFYRWLRGRADAVVHFGTHGTLEWLPGKAVALSGGCWPARLLGGMPVIYPFIVNNPGEAAVAKRRLAAVTIGHLTPPLVEAGLSGEARAVEGLIDELAACDGMDRRRAEMLRAEILGRAGASGLLDEAGAEEGEADGLARLDAYLCDVKEMRIADGLHVFGAAPVGREALLASVGAGAAEALDRCAGSERAALLAALDGRFVEPGPAGAPSQGRADVLPTGRNLAGVDPRGMPTVTAMRLAGRTAEALLARHRQETGDELTRLVVDLWGSASLRTGGEDLALAFVLMGVTPVWDEGSGRVSGVEVVPGALLDRPRVDVTLRVSGVFRDQFAGQIALFDAAVRRLAARGEAEGGLRVFGPAPGAYGVGADWLVGFGYGGLEDGVEAREALTGLAARAEAFVHQQDHRETDILDGPEHAAHEGGFARAAAGLGGAPALYHVDISDGARVRTVREEIVRTVRGRLANPVWLAGMRRHGFRGASEMARGVEALGDFARALPDRFDAQFDLVAAALLADDENGAFLAGAVEAQEAIRRVLRDARDEGLWVSRRNDVGELV